MARLMDARTDAAQLLEEQIAYVAAVHDPHGTGGYGATWWHAGLRKVFWICADWTTNDEVDSATRQFQELRGVTLVEACAECYAPEGNGWVQVYPQPGIYDQEPITAAVRGPDREWPHGLRCADCNREIKAGDPYEVRQLSDDVGEIVCPDCAALTAALPSRHGKPLVPVGKHNAILKQGYKRAEELEPRLARIIQPILDKAVDDAARKFLTHVTDHLTAAADVTSRSTMVALYPRPDEQQAIADAHPGGEDPGTIHLTLAYMGELDDNAVEQLVECMAPVAATHPPLEGHVGGVGAFDDNGNGVPAIALPDVRGLTELRQGVVQAITDRAGIDFARDHGFTPHLTVAYREGRSHPARRRILGQPLHFDALHVVQGDRVIASHPLTGAPALTAAGPPDWTPPAPDELINVPALAEQILAKTEPVRKAFVEAVMTPALKEAGLSFDVNNPLAAKALASSAKHVTNIAETTRENVRKSIAAGYQTGLSIPDTAKLIRVAGTGMNNVRATMIARTELTGAVNAGSIAATQIIGQETNTAYTKTWRTAPGAMYPRHETYDDLDGQTVPLDGVFNVGGSELEFPGDPGGDPGEVINCRCTMTYSSPEGEQSADAEETPDLATISSEGELGGELGEPISEGEGGGAAPMVVPANRFAAADQMMAGVVESATRSGTVPDAAEVAAGNANWRKILSGKIDVDKATLAKVKDADAYNLTSAVHEAQVAKYGQDAAIVVRPVKPGSPIYIKPGQAAHRSTVNRVTLISSDERNFTGIRELPQPGDATTAARGGLSATLRHEYAHQIYDGLSAEQRSGFLDALPAREQIRNDLSLYASTDHEEAFSELYAIVSDPSYDPSAWAPWIRKLGHDLFGAPLDKGAAAAPAARAVVVPAAPAGTGSVAADVAKLKASTSWLTDKETLLQRGDQYTDPTHGLAQVGLIPASELAQEQLGVTLQAGARVRQEMTLDPALAQRITDAQARVEQADAARTAEISQAAETQKAARTAYLAAETAEQDRLAMGRYGKAYRDLDYQQKADVLKILADPAVANPEVTRLQNVYYAAIDASNALHDQLNLTPVRQAQLAAQREARALRSEQATQIRDEAMRVLGEIRSMGATSDSSVQWGSVGSKAGPKKKLAQEALTKAQANLPTDWIAALKPVDAGYAGRGYEQDFGVGHKIRISDRGRTVIEGDLAGQPTALHELGHAVEAQVPMVQQLEQAFYQWRTRGGSFTADQEKSARLSRLIPGSGYGAKEIAREDKFADPYFGKDYSRSGRTMNFELLTMGLESLFNGSYVLDDEYLHWLLGVLALA